MARTEILTPHWPSLLRFFQQAAAENKGTAKGRMFTERANEIRDYLASLPNVETK